MSSQVCKYPVIALNSNTFIPLIGYTASVYKNETDIGEALKELLPENGLQRKDVFITSKLGPANQGKDKCRTACLESIQRLQCDYLDLYLIHWPGTQGKKPEEPVNKELRLQSWQDMIQLHKEGKVKAIGVSNFLQHHIEDIISETNVVPAVLQIEHHPHLVQDNLICYCREKGIHFQAYSSLGTSVVENKLLSDETVKDIAKIHSKTTAQILLKWAVQQNIGVIPKSTNPDHIRENMDIFDFSLSQQDIDILNKLDKQIHYCWNPTSVS
ncbi:glyoxal reductase-like isoform X2 [Mytilus trossulus]|uniref:glyoxal reductase-like isoform X2 n=1 Tax=Mytilus trossulus TaxID=6551 RepID=UPI0030041D45